MDRRFFLKTSVGAAAFLACPRRGRADETEAEWPVTSPALQKFIQPLPTLAQMAPATPVASADPNVDYYEIAMRQFEQVLHPAFMDHPTQLWGYCDLAATTQRHLGGAIIARKGRPVRIRFVNDLPPTHLFATAIDNTVLPSEHADAALHPNRACPHLHGGKVPWVSDGGPLHWFAPPDLNGQIVYGASVPVPGWLPDPATGQPTNDYWYPNTESARLMWYHDHAVGNTRLNAYAGMAAPYIVRDGQENALISRGAIPAREIPLVFQDKIFTESGQLWYPTEYNEHLFGPANAPSISGNPEFWGDTMLTNGVVYPFLDVEPRRYRFRMLNACNTRFLNLRLVAADSIEPTEPGNGPSVPIQVIGTEGGFLDPVANPKGVMLNELLLGPAERFDVIIDFSDLAPGTTLILANDAAVPFPDGYGVKSNVGYGPDTVTLLQIVVGPRVGPQDPPPPKKWDLPKSKLLVPVAAGALAPLTPPSGAVVQDLALNEGEDEYNRLMPTLGNITQGKLSMSYFEPATERPVAGAVEVWRIFNRTADAHPIHFHLANAQLLSRQPFVENDGAFTLTELPIGPQAWELGWKETIIMNSGECTTVAMRFDLPPDPVVAVNGVATPVAVPQSTRTELVDLTGQPIPGTGGYEYVWHCHILEHEEHDMMRPLVVMPVAVP